MKLRPAFLEEDYLICQREFQILHEAGNDLLSYPVELKHGSVRQQVQAFKTKSTLRNATENE